MNKFNFLVFLMFVSLTLLAQPTTEEMLEAEELEIVKSFNAQLDVADKKSTNPTLPPLQETGRPELNYSIPTKLLSIKYDAPTIRPISMRSTPLPEVYNFWSRLGFGTPISPYAEVIYNNGKSEKMDIYARLKHHSANANKKRENQRFAENELDLKGKYYLEKGNAVGAHLDFDLDNFHFYGYNQEDTSFAKKDVLQRFTTFGAGVNLENSKLNTAKVNYDVGLDFYTHGDRYDASEFGLGINVDLLKWIANDKHHFDLSINESYRTFNDTIAQNNNLISAAPSFTFRAGIFKMKLGAWLGYDGEFDAYPDVEAALYILGGKVSVFAGWNGRIQQNNFRDISDYNPFIESQFTLQNSRLQNRYGGFKGKIDAFGFEARITQRPVKNMILYLNDTLDTKRFDVLYDDVNVLNLHGTLSTTVIQKLELLVSIDYHIYNTLLETAPWQLPNLEANIGGKYSPINNLTVRGEAYFGGGAAYRDALGVEQTQKALFDLSFGADYQVTKQIGVYLDVNNLTGSRFQRWNLYPQYGLNFMGGVTLKF